MRRSLLLVSAEDNQAVSETIRILVGTVVMLDAVDGGTRGHKDSCWPVLNLLNILLDFILY